MFVFKIIRIIKNEGMYEVFKKIKNRVYCKVNIYYIDIKDSVNFKKEENWENFIMVQADDSLLKKMADKYKDEISNEKIGLLTKRIQNKEKNRVYITMDTCGEILGFYCIAFGNHYDDYMKYVVKQKANEIHLYDGYTFKKHRKKGVQKFFNYKIIDSFRNCNYDVVTTMVVDDNIYSKKAVEKIGFKKCGEVLSMDFKISRLNIKKNKSNVAKYIP